MIHGETTQSRITAVHADAPAERLFFAQYRLWMAGHASGDTDYWDCALDVLLRFTSPESAKILCGEFHQFTCTLNKRARKEILWRFSACRCLCMDEFLVLRLVAASQRKDHDEENLAAMSLLGSADAGVILRASRSLAEALQLCHFVLAPIERLPVIENLPHAPQSYTLQ